MTDARSARHGLVQGAIGFASRAVVQLCVLGVTVVAIRSLQVSEFGSYAIAAAFMFLFRRLFYVGPYEHMLKTPAYDALNGSCLVANGAFVIGSMVLTFAISFVSAPLFGTDLVGGILRALAPSLLLTMWTSWFEAHLLRQQRINKYYLFTITGELIGAAAAIWALAAGYGVYSLVVQVYARLATLLLCYLASTRERIWHGYDLGESRKIIAWSRSRYATVFVNFFSVYGSDLMLGAVLSPAATGLFRAGNRIVTALTDLFAQPLQKIAQTNLSARSAHGLQSDQSWLGMFSAVAAVGWAALAALACLAHELVPAVFGDHWRPTVPIVAVLCAVRALPILDATTVSMLVCGNRQRFIFNVQAVTATFVLAAGFVFAFLGPLAVAIALGVVLLGQSFALCREVSRISAVTASEMAAAFAVALTPAGCVFLTVQLSQYVMPPIELAWIRISILTLAAACGTAIGLVIVKGAVIGSARLLAPFKPVVPQSIQS